VAWRPRSSKSLGAISKLRTSKRWLQAGKPSVSFDIAATELDSVFSIRATCKGEKGMG
jgi:hypothetical protein